MSVLSADRRQFLHSSGAFAATLSLNYAVPSVVHAQAATDPIHGQWEDIMRSKWTWDRVVRGSRPSRR